MPCEEGLRDVRRGCLKRRYQWLNNEEQVTTVRTVVSLTMFSIIRLKMGQLNFQRIFPCIEGAVFGGNARTIISTESALRLPTTNDNHPIPSSTSLCYISLFLGC